ncbi:MAG: restriction endonuclease subunit S [Syntrophomonadaceae bacterium]|jgi:restriction endonuclease S subunit
MRYKKLSDIAEVQSGLVLSRKEAKYNPEQSVEYMRLNLRSINDDGSISKESLDRYCANEKLEEQFITNKNDIIVRLFPPFCPALITDTFINLVVPSQFAIIRLKSDSVIPEFLCCYLFHHNMLEALAIRESGQYYNGIKISTLSRLEIPLLPLHTQKTIAAYGEMHMKRKQLYLDLIQQYDIKMDAVLNRAIGGKRHGNNQKRY